jgi:hypothetical protein
MTRMPRLFLFFAALLLSTPSAVTAQSGESRPQKESEKQEKQKEQQKPSEKEKKEDKGEGQTAEFVRLRIEVTAGAKNDPVENASVYVVYFEERAIRRDRRVEMNLKTNREGRTNVPRVPRGKVLVQVIATGWKTFGQWYDIEKEEETIKIRLQEPPRWY